MACICFKRVHVWLKHGGGGSILLYECVSSAETEKLDRADLKTEINARQSKNYVPLINDQRQVLTDGFLALF